MLHFTSNAVKDVKYSTPYFAQKRMPEVPPTSVDVPQERRGGLGLEVYKGDTWEDVTHRNEEQTSTIRTEEDTDADDPSVDDLDMEFEEMVMDDPVSIFVY